MTTPTSRLHARMRIVGFAVYLVLLTCGDLLGAGHQYQARGVMMPVYVTSEREAVGVIRVENVYPGHQRRGIFRIGLLPAVILEKVRIQIAKPEHAPAVLAEVLRVGPAVERSEGIELRDVQILLAGQDEPIVEAGTALLDALGHWRLGDGVRFQRGEVMVRARAATLEQDAASASPMLVWTSPTGDNRIHLFTRPDDSNSDPETP